MGEWSVLSVSHDALSQMGRRETDEEIGVKLIRACRLLGFQEEEHVDGGGGTLAYALPRRHGDFGQVLIFQGGQLRPLRGRVDGSDSDAVAIARALAAMDLTGHDKAMLMRALGGHAPPDAATLRETADRGARDGDDLNPVIDPTRPADATITATSGEYMEATIRLPTRGGGWIIAELTFHTLTKNGSAAVYPAIPLPEVCDDAKMTVVPMRGWGAVNVSHDLDLAACATMDAADRVDTCTLWLKRRLSGFISTRRGDIFELGCAAENALGAFATLDLDRSPVDDGAVPTASGHELLEGEIVAGDVLRPATYRVWIKQGRGHVHWRIHRALDLILQHFAPWGADLIVLDGRVHTRTPQETFLWRFYSADEAEEIARARAELWRLLEHDMGLDAATIAAAFDLPPGARSFACLPLAR